MKFSFPTIIFFLSGYFLSSCVSYRYIDLQVLNPGTIKIPYQVDEFHIVNSQKMDRDFDVVIKDSAKHPGAYYKMYIQTFDSLLKIKLESSPFFEHSKVVVQNEKSFQAEMKNLSQREKEKHLIASVTKLSLIDTIKPNTESIDYDTRYNYYSLYSIYYLFKLELVNAGSGRYEDTFSFHDTLTWSGVGDYRQIAESMIPSTPEAILETAKIAAEKYAKRIAAYWSTEERMLFYNNNKYMRSGYHSFTLNDLESAIKSWKYLYDVGTPELASLAAHNIGLVYEMLDDFTNSELWLNNSLKNKWHIQTEEYLDRIKLRKASVNKL
jgi:hypothetical protein